ncbi:restriction endonuclease subunit S [Psychrobacter celer]|uniref:restriction endonuclease subunit S n=1 Tax=Psychrobacter celer TaxID=306572 RepID=UPI003FD5317B
MVPYNFTPLNDFVSTDAPICYGILKPGNHIENGVPVVKVKNIYSGQVHTDKLLKTSHEIHEQYKRAEISGGDLLLTIRGTTGRVGIVPDELGVANITQDTARIRVSTDDCSLYLFYALQSPDTQRQIKLNTVGQAVKGINIAEVKKLKILHPPSIDQQKIAKILSTWDKAISTTERLIENSTQQKKALMQQLLTGKKRLLDEAGKRFEGEWEEVTVSSFGKVVTGSTPPKNDSSNYDGNISWATAEDFKQKYVSNTKVKLTESGATKARVVPKGSVLVTCIASIGKNAIANEDLATNQQINSVVINKNNSNEFFYYLIEFNTHKLLAWAGTTAVPILNKTSFEKVKFIVPNLKEQQKIATVLTNADKEIELLEQQLADLQQEKKALMQVLLTGKKRVRLND